MAPILSLAGLVLACAGFAPDDPCQDLVAGTDAWSQGTRWSWTLSCPDRAPLSGSYALGPARFELQSPVHKPLGDPEAPSGWQHCAPRIGLPCNAGDRSVRAPLSDLRGTAPLDGEYRRFCAAEGGGSTVLYLPGGPSGLLRCRPPASSSGTGRCEDARSEAPLAAVPQAAVPQAAVPQAAVPQCVFTVLEERG